MHLEGKGELLLFSLMGDSLRALNRILSCRVLCCFKNFNGREEQ